MTSIYNIYIFLHNKGAHLWSEEVMLNSNVESSPHIEYGKLPRNVLMQPIDLQGLYQASIHLSKNTVTKQHPSSQK